jgi:nucleotide-binding universal stress UspA family protein
MPGVVVGIDGSEHAQRALLSAVAEAGLRGATLTVVHVAPLPFDLSGPILARQPTEQELRSLALQLIEETLQDLDTGDLEVERSH